MSFEIGRWRAREWFVLGCAVLVLLVSLSDWYGVRVRESDVPTAAWRDVATANAWHASTWWTLAVGVTAFAVALWLAYRGQAAQPRWVRRTAVTLVLAALGAIGWQYLTLGEVDRTTAAATTGVGLDSATPAPAGTITSTYVVQLSADRPDPIDRDDLVSGTWSDYAAGPRWGTTAATTLLTVILLALLTTPAPQTPADAGPSEAGPAG